MFEDDDIREIGQRLLATEGVPCSDVEQIDRIHQLERLTAHVQAQLMSETTTFLDGRRVGGWRDPAEHLRDVKLDSANDEVALARGISAVTSALHTATAEILINDLPTCFRALDEGRISLHAARSIVNEAQVLSPQQRNEIDDATALEVADLLPGQVRDSVRARVLAVDSAAAERRAANARADKQVGLVKRGDGVALVFGRLPAEDATACWDAIDTHARRLRDAGDERTLNDIRCDTFVSRLTGAEPAAPAKVELGVVISAATWLGLTDTPASLTGYGAIHPGMVRDIVDGADTWIRRLMVDPNTGEVLSIDSKARKVTGLLRTFGTYRDQVCRRPYCTNPITDFNHIKEHAKGGRTNHHNIDGLCEPCHLSRHRAGWTQRTDPFTGRIEWITPTGHVYGSDPPPAIGYGTLSARLLRMIVQHPLPSTAPPDGCDRSTRSSGPTATGRIRSSC